MFTTSFLQIDPAVWTAIALLGLSFICSTVSLALAFIRGRSL